MLPDLRLGARGAFKNFTLSKWVSLVSLATLLWGQASSNGQSNTQAGGADAANLTAKVDAIFANYNKPDSPGCALGVIKDGKLVYTRGLRDYAALFGLAGSNFEDTSTDDDALKMIVRQKALNFTPGDEWLYSNSGYFL